MDYTTSAAGIGMTAFVLIGIRIGCFSARGIGLFLCGGVVVSIVIVSGGALVFIVTGAVFVIGSLIFLAMRYGHEPPPQNEAPCDPNWKPVQYKKPGWLR
jgi:hypothetical protein